MDLPVGLECILKYIGGGGGGTSLLKATGKLTVSYHVPLERTKSIEGTTSGGKQAEAALQGARCEQSAERTSP
jgi:hypothetical protein